MAVFIVFMAKAMKGKKMLSVISEPGSGESPVDEGVRATLELWAQDSFLVFGVRIPNG